MNRIVVFALALSLVFCALSAAAEDRVGEVQELAPGVYFHVVVRKIREMTDKPIRFAFNTHHHGDHRYGNRVWVEERIARYVGTDFDAQVEKIWTGLGGAPFADSRLEAHRRRHARQHYSGR